MSGTARQQRQIIHHKAPGDSKYTDSVCVYVNIYIKIDIYSQTNIALVGKSRMSKQKQVQQHYEILITANSCV